jgi:very-short-patch-repair endonuclease
MKDPSDNASAPFPLDGGRVGDGGGNLSAEGARPRHTPGAIPRARRMRREPTVAERMLWAELRKLNLNVRRQAPIGRYIADFASHTARVVIEVDGPIHDEPEVQARDAERTAWLESQGYRVIRIPEKMVRDRLHKVAERLAAVLAPPPSPTLPPSRGKGEKRYDIR